MKVRIIYAKWPKLKFQPEFHLPPHGPVVFASALPEYVDIRFTDEHVTDVDFDDNADLIFMSVMLTCQIPRAWEISDEFRKRGKTVIFGGIAAQLHAEETLLHADSVFLGEAEGRMEGVLSDFRNNNLQKVYNFHNMFPDISEVKTARRDILDRERYNFRGIQMVDLVHASRGCRFNCFPCCTPYLGGRQFRPRPIDAVLEELESIPNNRIFLVDNSLAQDDQWEKDLFREMAPLKKKWVSHPIKDDPEILDLAAKAGAWYVYQAIVDTSDHIRDRIKRYKDHGILVEGTIILGCDAVGKIGDHDEDRIKRLVDFLLEIDLDMAEFTILTPFPGSSIRRQYEKENRILSNDWSKYTCDRAVFQPKQMTPEKLEQMYDYAWETFYAESSKEIRMAKLFLDVLKKEKKDGTYKRYDPKNKKRWGRKENEVN